MQLRPALGLAGRPGAGAAQRERLHHDQLRGEVAGGARPSAGGALIQAPSALSPPQQDGRAPTQAPQYGLRNPHARYPAEPHPQLLHHRPYRPWEIDARRPADPDHRHGRAARHEGADARQHGYRAGARDHHQGADRPHPVQGPGWGDLHPQPHGHAGPCRLRLRGLPQPRRLRRQPAGGRCLAGRRGPDPGECLPGAGSQPRDRPGAQQGGPAGRRARPGEAADRGRHRPRRLGRRADQRQDRPEHRGRAGGDRDAPAAAHRRCLEDPDRPAGRQLVRRLSRRRRAGPGRGTATCGRASASA